MPDDDILKVWIRAYLECSAEIKGNQPDTVTEDEVSAFLGRAQLWSLVKLSIITHRTYGYGEV